MNDELADRLARTALGQDLRRDEVARLTEEGRVEHWPRGSVIVEEGTVGPRLVVILEGRATVSKRDDAGVEHPIAELGPGAVLGEMSLLLHQPRTATVRAVDNLRVFAMERAAFQQMLDDGDPAAMKAGVALAKALAQRLVEQNERVVTLLAEIRDHKKRADFLRSQSELEWRWDRR